VLKRYVICRNVACDVSLLTRDDQTAAPVVPLASIDYDKQWPALGTVKTSTRAAKPVTIVERAGELYVGFPKNKETELKDGLGTGQVVLVTSDV